MEVPSWYKSDVIGNVGSVVIPSFIRPEMSEKDQITSVSCCICDRSLRLISVTSADEH